jgi:hypothetical protein
MAILIRLAGRPVAGSRLDHPGALRPERPTSRRAPSRPGATKTGSTATSATGPAPDPPAAPGLARAHFLIHQLLAEAPELAAPPSRPRTLAAYQAQLAHRIHYSGPVAPIDLRV